MQHLFHVSKHTHTHTHTYTSTTLQGLRCFFYSCHTFFSSVQENLIQRNRASLSTIAMSQTTLLLAEHYYCSACLDIIQKKCASPLTTAAIFPWTFMIITAVLLFTLFQRNRVSLSTVAMPRTTLLLAEHHNCSIISIDLIQRKRVPCP